MTIQDRMNALIVWGNAIAAMLDELDSNTLQEGNILDSIITKAHHQNQWFTSDQTRRALRSLSSILERSELERWILNYSNKIELPKNKKRVGVIMAGNIPAVGFHDALCVLASGNTLLAKCANDDKILIPFLLEVLITIEPRFRDDIHLVDRLENLDAVIATGSNNSSRYFDFYFGKYPHVIRKNRNSIAVLDGTESEKQLEALADDIFAYFGLGCRNVSKLYVPEGYDFAKFFPAMQVYGSLMMHSKYMNNYDYHHALFLLNDEKFLTNNYLIVRENEALSTPVSVLHYEFYKSLPELNEKLNEMEDQIQCRVGVGGLPFGTSQQPGIADYADGVDTMAFLLQQ